MSSLAIKRIYKDIKIFKNSNLDKVGIYCDFDEKDIFNVKCMIIGPKDTPYQYGYYLFNLTFPNDYPINPPHVKFMTQGDNIRFNPNLYKNGKVCLSILGTWDGPSWSGCLNLNSVLISIQSLLNENPIHNEPGWENINDQRSLDYIKILKYSNLKVSLLNMIDNPPYGFECFKEVMMEYLKENKDYFLEYSKSEDFNIKTYIYSMQIKTNFKEQYERLCNLLDIKERKISKYTRKAPKENSNNFDVGYEKISENDGKVYIVYLTKTNKKRWKKK